MNADHVVSVILGSDEDMTGNHQEKKTTMVKKRTPFVWTDFLWSSMVKMVNRFKCFASLTFVFQRQS